MPGCQNEKDRRAAMTTLICNKAPTKQQDQPARTHEIISMLQAAVLMRASLRPFPLLPPSPPSPRGTRVAQTLAAQGLLWLPLATRPAHNYAAAAPAVAVRFPSTHCAAQRL